MVAAGIPGGNRAGTCLESGGNQLTSTPANLTWNALNQPITVNSTGATYDALGRMVEKGSGGTYTQFVFQPSGAILAVYSGGLVKGTIPLPGGSTAIYNSSGLNFIRHTDWLGSSRLATTWAHAVYSKEAYAPFGETYNEAGTSPDRSFTGQDQDVATGTGGAGVYDFLFRKYDPSAGRWLSPDPYGWNAVDPTAPQSLNRYAYVMNNPMTYRDQLGLSYQMSCDPQEYGVSTGDDTSVEVEYDPNCTMIDDGQGLPQATLPDEEEPQLQLQLPGVAAPNNPNTTVKCRGIETDNLGATGMQHCDAQVTDCNGVVHSISGGPVNNYMNSGQQVLDAWDTSPPTAPFTGNTVYQGNLSCTVRGCLIESTQEWNQSIVKPLYHPITGPNSNTFLKNTFAGCTVSLPINTWGSIW
jgi:RHS repeat-associated protein